MSDLIQAAKDTIAGKPGALRQKAKSLEAIATERYEYAVQFKNEESGKWYTNGFYGRGMHGRKWFASKEEAEQQIKRAYPADLAEPREHRIVRRRVSLPEVINE